MNSTAILKVPVSLAGCTFLQTLDTELFDRCLAFLQREFKKAALREEIKIRGKTVSGEFHNMEGRDGQAGMMLLEFLLAEGYQIERVDVMQSEQGIHIISTVYTLKKAK